MKNLTLFLLLFLGISIGASASSFKFNQDKFETAFEQSEDLTSQLFMTSGGSLISSLATSVSGDSMEKQTLAAIVAIASVVVGYFTLLPLLFPTHRFILGTGGKGVGIWAVYCFTLSGLGWLNIIDAVFLLMDDTKSEYIDKGKILMWIK